MVNRVVLSAVLAGHARALLPLRPPAPRYQRGVGRVCLELNIFFFHMHARVSDRASRNDFLLCLEEELARRVEALEALVGVRGLVLVRVQPAGDLPELLPYFLLGCASRYLHASGDHALRRVHHILDQLRLLSAVATADRGLGDPRGSLLLLPLGCQ